MAPRPPAARDRLAVALDCPTLEAAEALVERLAGVPGWLKVGAELFAAAGPAAIALAAKQARVFLDLKLHDIPNTVAAAVGAAARHGVGLLTLHAAGGRAMLEAARGAADAAARASGSAPALLGVTVLTSLGEGELREVGVASPPEDQVLRLAQLALDCGLEGVVASPREVARLRARFGDALTLVTPGIRPRGAAADDQSRTASAGEAIRAGADLLVVGRPVTRAADPAAAARALVAEIEEARGAGPA